MIIETLSNQWWKDIIGDYWQSHERVDNLGTGEDSTTSSDDTEEYNNLKIEILNYLQSNNPDNYSNQDELSGNLDLYSEINQWLKDNISDYWQKFGFEVNLVP